MLFRTFALLLPLGFLAAVLLAARAGTIPGWIGLVYAGGSGVTLLAYGLDKRRARRDEWRIRESTLHWLALLGGWPGALLGSGIFRHKISQTDFKLDLWIIVLAHLFLWTWLLTHWPAAWRR